MGRIIGIQLEMQDGGGHVGLRHIENELQLKLAKIIYQEELVWY